METLKAKVVKPARRQVAKKKTGKVQAEDTRKVIESTLLEVAENILGKPVDLSTIQKILSDLNIDPSAPLSDNDKFLLYNVLMEPIVAEIKESEDTYEIDRENVSEDQFVQIVDQVDEELQEISQANRVIGLYDVLPSLKVSRMNFGIEKDIFRNKPLLGKGLFKCKYCGSDNTEDYELQTRRADEGAWVKVICRACTKQYIIT